MKLEMARHPCLEVQDDVAFIANDITLERSMKKSKFASVFSFNSVFVVSSINKRPTFKRHCQIFSFLFLCFVYIFVYTGRRQGIFDHHWPKHGRQVDLHQTGLLGSTVKILSIVFILLGFWIFVILLSENRLQMRRTEPKTNSGVGH